MHELAWLFFKYTGAYLKQMSGVAMQRDWKEKQKKA